jgi:hypothetical protein
MVKMELFEHGTVIPRGKGSKAIPLSAALAKLKGDVKVGDPYEIYLDNGEVIIRFPKPQPATATESEKGAGPF